MERQEHSYTALGLSYERADSTAIEAVERVIEKYAAYPWREKETAGAAAFRWRPAADRLAFAPGGIAGASDGSQLDQPSDRGGQVSEKWPGAGAVFGAQGPGWRQNSLMQAVLKPPGPTTAI